MSDDEGPMLCCHEMPFEDCYDVDDHYGPPAGPVADAVDPYKDLGIPCGNCNLDELDALAAAATQGKWRIEQADDGTFYGQAPTFDITSTIGIHREPVVGGGFVEDGGPCLGAAEQPDAGFIVALVNAWRSGLADRVRQQDETIIELRAEAAEASSEIQSLMGQCAQLKDLGESNDGSGSSTLDADADNADGREHVAGGAGEPGAPNAVRDSRASIDGADTAHGERRAEPGRAVQPLPEVRAVEPLRRAESSPAVELAPAESWLQQCGSCDAGLPMSCTCPTGDPRNVIADLVERLAAAEGRVRQLEAENERHRDYWNESNKILHRVFEIIDEAEDGEYATKGRDFGRGVAHLAALVLDALDPSNDIPDPILARAVAAEAANQRVRAEIERQMQTGLGHVDQRAATRRVLAALDGPDTEEGNRG